MSETEQNGQNRATTDDPIEAQRAQQKLHTQLYWRLGVAVVLIGAVVGALRWLDRSGPAQSAAQIAPPSPIASAPAAVGASAIEPEATDEAPPVQASAPAGSPETARPQAPTTAMPPEQQAPAPQAAAPQAPQPAQPVEATTAPVKVATPPPVAIVKRPDGYTVQAGVFLHSDNAEKLLRKLQAAGVPAYLETRVQIGPFKTRAEADAAARKLRTLGIAPVVGPALNQD
ncbi:SPOR domain-containing protein [Jeongeupia sp. USM3]|uniref:SPOR domain-containing protein n=1 Tax=Jeongeupia sp. USM3 TaxID=1906741 RepID=UPI00089E06AF|nr:SPOR domain-containing protein [Jeongeupia sp. USM3]AOX99583.1 hypothetical protein BJP62_03400 [Jeongeupia sp. USM3]